MLDSEPLAVIVSPPFNVEPSAAWFVLPAFGEAVVVPVALPISCSE